MTTRLSGSNPDRKIKLRCADLASMQSRGQKYREIWLLCSKQVTRESPGIALGKMAALCGAGIALYLKECQACLGSVFLQEDRKRAKDCNKQSPERAAGSMDDNTGVGCYSRGRGTPCWRSLTTANLQGLGRQGRSIARSALRCALPMWLYDPWQC
jgi:hypothetical protein